MVQAPPHGVGPGSGGWDSSPGWNSSANYNAGHNANYNASYNAADYDSPTTGRRPRTSTSSDRRTPSDASSRSRSTDPTVAARPPANAAWRAGPHCWSCW